VEAAVGLEVRNDSGCGGGWNEDEEVSGGGEY
jgi:hypothetical protein